jgi:hypothetical protein
VGDFAFIFNGMVIFGTDFLNNFPIRVGDHHLIINVIEDGFVETYFRLEFIYLFGFHGWSPFYTPLPTSRKSYPFRQGKGGEGEIMIFNLSQNEKIVKEELEEKNIGYQNLSSS